MFHCNSIHLKDLWELWCHSWQPTGLLLDWNTTCFSTNDPHNNRHITRYTFKQTLQFVLILDYFFHPDCGLSWCQSWSDTWGVSKCQLFVISVLGIRCKEILSPAERNALCLLSRTALSNKQGLFFFLVGLFYLLWIVWFTYNESGRERVLDNQQRLRSASAEKEMQSAFSDGLQSISFNELAYEGAHQKDVKKWSESGVVEAKGQQRESRETMGGRRRREAISPLTESSRQREEPWWGEVDGSVTDWIKKEMVSLCWLESHVAINKRKHTPIRTDFNSLKIWQSA